MTLIFILKKKTTTTTTIRQNITRVYYIVLCIYTYYRIDRSTVSFSIKTSTRWCSRIICSLRCVYNPHVCMYIFNKRGLFHPEVTFSSLLSRTSLFTKLTKLMIRSPLYYNERWGSGSRFLFLFFLLINRQHASLNHVVLTWLMVFYVYNIYDTHDMYTTRWFSTIYTSAYRFPPYPAQALQQLYYI